MFADAREKLERKYQLAASGYTLDRLIEQVARLLGMASKGVIAPRKNRQRVETRNLLCYWVATELGVSQTQLAGRLSLNQPAVSNAVKRGPYPGL